MTFSVEWDPPALVAFYRVGIAGATSVDRAVIRFAETGVGDLEFDPPYHRLRAGRYDVLLTIDVQRRTITVLRFYRVRA
jgi:hypothetical protein